MIDRTPAPPTTSHERRFAQWLTDDGAELVHRYIAGDATRGELDRLAIAHHTTEAAIECMIQDAIPSRFAELDAYLEEIGGHVIHITDLEAAMLAQEWGRAAFSGGRVYSLTGRIAVCPGYFARHAAHHARRALGES